MEGLTASELTLIRRLAGNDALVRKKTIKKLRTWLSAILKRVPDTPDCRQLIENNFLRVWKALFYCMWMADKPLPQEQLAEQISSLVDIFSSKPHVMNLFIEWFFRTMAREWQWIDRFRMDKFMMLVRRFFRKSLEAVSQHQWKLEALDGFLNIITVIIFNHHPDVKKTRSKARDPSPEISPLGLQIHIVDIFLEEVAKVGGHRLKSKKILKILKPFICELSTNDDERILNEIRERIFFHLMKQSDVGIDYSEDGDTFNCEEEELSSDQDNHAEESPKGKKNKNNRKREEEEDFNEDEGQMLSGPLDPRAGAVDVILPQLEIDYKDLAERLIKVGGQKTVKMRNRKLLYSLARQFQQLTVGEYPLAIKLDAPKPAIRQKDVNEAAKRLMEIEESMANPDRKKRQPKKLRKKLAKQKILDEMQQDMLIDNSIDSSTDGEANSSIYLEDNELLDHVGDNYMSYLEELQQDDLVDTNGIDNEEVNVHEEEKEDEIENPSDEDGVNFNLSGDEEDEDEDEEDEDEEDEDEQDEENENVRARRLKNNKMKTIAQGVSPAQLAKDNNNIKLQHKKRMKSLLINGCAGSPKAPSTKKKSLLNSIRLSEAVSINEDEEEEETQSGSIFCNIYSPRPCKKRKMNDSFNLTPTATNSPAATSSSTKRKRVSFVLARNLQHEHSDYKDSIQRSPAIPFDSTKKPNYGLLKSPKTLAASTSLSNSPFRSRISYSARRASGRF